MCCIALWSIFHVNWVDLPIDAKLYHELLEKKAADSRFVKHVREATVDVSGTF